MAIKMIDPNLDPTQLVAASHLAGLCLWQLARLGFLLQVPGAWYSNVPIIPFDKGVDRSRSKLTRLVQMCEQRGLPVPEGVAEARRLVERIGVEGFDTEKRCLLQAMFLARVAERLMHEPSTEHAMALRLLARSRNYLNTEEHFDHAMSRFVEIGDRKEFGEGWLLFYECREMCTRGERDLAQLEERTWGQDQLVRYYEGANDHFDRAIDICERLRMRHPGMYSDHVAAMSLFGRWASHVAMAAWQDAADTWVTLINHHREFAGREMPVLADYPRRAAAYAETLETTEASAVQVRDGLYYALRMVKTDDQRRAIRHALKRLERREMQEGSERTKELYSALERSTPPPVTYFNN